MEVRFGQPGVAGTRARLTAVDVSPVRERVECEVCEQAGFRGSVQVEHRCQVVAVAAARLGAGVLDLLPTLGGTRDIGKIDHI